MKNVHWALLVAALVVVGTWWFGSKDEPVTCPDCACAEVTCCESGVCKVDDCDCGCEH